MASIHVQFEDESEQRVVAVFGSEQQSDVYPNQAVIETTDLRYIEFYESFPVFMRATLPAP
ncbi:hypothetical protein J2W50_002017 [Herbaspirillum frisingense]|uniref:Uncharacterized protein n=1 Tax=Herbaspirillum frisingense TaxID=92645 RepID=A0ABU1PDB0_9BURK|nr:hypothetical protein [Herbaspirillum frisingense]